MWSGARESDSDDVDDGGVVWTCACLLVGANLSPVVSELGKRLLIRQVTLKVFVRVSGYARVFHSNHHPWVQIRVYNSCPESQQEDVIKDCNYLLVPDQEIRSTLVYIC